MIDTPEVLVAPQMAAAINDLYQEAEEPRPSVNRPIAPLSRLIKGYLLTCQELPQLSSLAAMHFLLRRGGLMSPLQEANDEPLAGFLYANAGGGSIFVRQEDPVARRRFSAAHELGHYRLHFPLLLEAAQQGGRTAEVEMIELLPTSLDAEAEEPSTGRLVVQESGVDPSGPTASPLPPLLQMEREADTFAAELLMPETVLCELVQRYRPHFSDVDLIWRLSTEMLVSRAAMRIRLFHLGLLHSEQAECN